jgi:hypothetical protein
VGHRLVVPVNDVVSQMVYSRDRQPRSGGSTYQVVLERMCVIRTAAHIPLVRRAMRKYIRCIHFQEESRDRSIPQMG